MRLPLSPPGRTCWLRVFEERPLISPRETLQMCRGQRGAKLPVPDVSRCRLQSVHAAQNLLGSRSRSSGQTHLHILWMFGKNKMWGKNIVLKVFFHQQLHEHLRCVLAHSNSPDPEN